jgi:hypothetical protein
VNTVVNLSVEDYSLLMGDVFRWVDIYVSKDYDALIFKVTQFWDPEDELTVIFRNVRHLSTNDTVSHPRRLQEPQIWIS